MFDRTEKHPSRWYYGTSLSALAILAEEKGYTFVGTESHCGNAFFLRNDLAARVPKDIPRAAHFDPDTDAVMQALRGLPVFNVATKSIELI